MPWSIQIRSLALMQLSYIFSYYIYYIKCWITAMFWMTCTQPSLSMLYISDNACIWWGYSCSIYTSVVINNIHEFVHNLENKKMLYTSNTRHNYQLWIPCCVFKPVGNGCQNIQKHCITYLIYVGTLFIQK